MSQNDIQENNLTSETSYVNATFQALNNRHSIIYHFVMLYNDYIYADHDYGNGMPMTMIEVHTLSYIEDHPGTTVTTLSKHWQKTKGALSQIVSRLEKDGLVRKDKKEGNTKTVLLYTTKTGTEISKAHKLYDTLDIAKTLGKIGETCTPEEIDTFFKVINSYYGVILKDFEENKVTKRQGRRKNK